MFRMWGKIFKQNRLIKDTVICIDDETTSRTAKVFQSVNDICQAFDLPQPIWLDTNIKEFQSHNKTRFHSDHFIESIDFDFLEVHLIEE